MVPPSLLTATVVFAGVMSSLAVDAGYVVLVPLGAVLFQSVGRHPLAGLAAAFAGVSGGFSANLLITSLDPLLAGLSTEAARLVGPTYTAQVTGNYYFMIASVFLVTIVGSIVTTRIVEPRLGKPPAGDGAGASGVQPLSAVEGRGLRNAGLVFLGGIILLLILTLPEQAVLKNPAAAGERPITQLKPFVDSIVMILMLLFLLMGIAYGRTVRRLLQLVEPRADPRGQWRYRTEGRRTHRDSAPGRIQLRFRVHQPLHGVFLREVGRHGAGIRSDADAHRSRAEVTQAAYRVGDSTTNIITPLMQYFPVVIAFAQQYQKDAGIGTITAMMVPYSIALLVVWTLFFALWLLAGIPLGPGAPVGYPAS